MQIQNILTQLLNSGDPGSYNFTTMSTSVLPMLTPTITTGTTVRARDQLTD